MLGGVAEGLSRHLDVDVILIRVVFAALTIFGGAGILLYVAGWLTIPADNSVDSIASRALSLDARRVMVVGLSAAGVLATLDVLGTIGWGGSDPVAVVAIGLVAVTGVLFFSRRTRRPPEQGVAQGVGQQVWWQRPDPATYAGATAATLAAGDDTGGPGSQGGNPLAGSEPVHPGKPKAPRSHLFAVTMALIAIAIGVLWILDETIFSDVPPAAYPATVLGITALGLIVGTWWGRSRLLVLVGLVATLLTGATTAAGAGPHGEQAEYPATAAEVESSYRHGAGQLVLDLTEISDPENLQGRVVDIDARVGQVKLLVPQSMSVAIDAHVDHGDIVGLSDIASYDDGEKRVSASPDDVADADIVFDVELLVGEIRVESVL